MNWRGSSSSEERGGVWVAKVEKWLEGQGLRFSLLPYYYTEYFFSFRGREKERRTKCRRDVRNRRESFDRRSSRELSGHYISKPQQKLQTTTTTTVTLWYLGKLGLILNTYYDLLDTYKSTVYVCMIFTPEVSFYNIRAKWDTITDCIGQVTISNWIFTQRPKVTGTYLPFGSMVLAIWIKFCSAALYFF